MEKDLIIKALECCVKVGGYRDAQFCNDCPLHEERCALELPRNALSLIKELTEENTDLTANVLSKGVANLTLTEENERLRAERDTLDTLVKDLRARNNGLQRANASLAKDCDILEDELNECVNIKTDTVRKMQERAKKELRSGNAIMDKSIADIIDQIAKELLES